MSHRRLRWILWTLLSLGLIATALVIGVVVWVNWYLSSELRTRAIALLEERLESKVELKDLQISWRPQIVLHGNGLTIRHHGRTDVAPLIAIDQFTAEVTWTGLFEQPRRVSSVDIRGLRITMPPSSDGGIRDSESGGCVARDRHAAPIPFAPEPSPFVVDRLRSREATLTLVPSKPGKRPRVFDIGDVTLHGLALDRPAEFAATLTNPIPNGIIETEGRFGPWHPDVPAATPVRGSYRFSNADMSTINGLTGVLNSTGHYEGRLLQILVRGEVKVTDFGLTTSTNRLPLETKYAACVDGTDGDTYLDEVDARLAGTPIYAKGKVEGTVGVDGRTIALDARVTDGRIEDMLLLAVDDKTPLMRGRIDVRTDFLLSPGKQEVIQRLALKGGFALHNTHFTEGGVQSKINELSRRGRGDMKTEQASQVQSDLNGRFALNQSVLRLSTFTFQVPGASVELQGQYGLKSERIDFNGRVRTDATVSQMTTGFKSLLLKVVDPLFRRDGAGAVFPISIGGTRKEPAFKVDVKKALLRKN